MTPAEVLSKVWSLAGGDPVALQDVTLTGREPALASSFRVGVMAQATIAAATLAAAEVFRARTGRRQGVSVDMRHAAIEFRSERYMTIDGNMPRVFDPLFGTYRTGDGAIVRLHTNLPHHRAGILAMLGCGETRDDVSRALHNWNGLALETLATERGLVVALLRSPEDWAEHPQGRALARLPLLEIERIGEAPPRPWPRDAERPLSGIRVLDLTRIIAGPVCGRTLAAHGADVLLVSGPKLPSIPALVMDTGRGKLSTHIDLGLADGRAALGRLLPEADIFVEGYRPGAIAARGFSPEACAKASPGLVYVSLSAYGRLGPWANKRGFDSLVQTAIGINHAEAKAAGLEGARELPAQALDHATGYLMAVGALTALKRQRQEGGTWHVRASLAQTGTWAFALGRLAEGFEAPDPKAADVADLIETSDGGFGRMWAVRHSGRLSATPPRWARPSVPLGTDPACWPDTGN